MQAWGMEKSEMGGRPRRARRGKDEAINPEYDDKLDVLAKFLEESPQAYVVIEGFTDSTGNPQYNLELSRRRALSVEDYSMKKYAMVAAQPLAANVAEEMFVTIWHGKALPVASNDTAEGRRLNRRVRITIRGL